MDGSAGLDPARSAGRIWESREGPGQRDTRPRYATAIRWIRDRYGVDTRPGPSYTATPPSQRARKKFLKG